MPPNSPITYEADFYGWIQQQTALLRSRQLAQIDIENIIEELETLGRSERRALISQLTRLYLHLLKWHYQAERRSRSWLVSIVDARLEIQNILADNPSLKPWLPEAAICLRQACANTAYADARTKAQAETGLPLATFPPEPTFSWQEAMTQEINGEAAWD